MPGGFISDASYIPAGDISDASLNTDFNFISSTPLNISLLEFDKNVFLDVSGILSKSAYDPRFTDYDSVVALDVSLVTFRNMFGVESDALLVEEDLSDPALLDNVHFIVYQSEIADFVPNIGTKGLVISGSEELVSSLGAPMDQHARNDFVRHLANILFNTSYATELFINQELLVQSVKDAFDAAWDQCKNTLEEVSNTNNSAYMTLDASGSYYYLTDASNNSHYGHKNICGEIFKQIVSRDPERFMNTNTLRVPAVGPDGQGLAQFYLPLIENDIINIKITLNANSNQDTFGLTYAQRSSSFNPDDHSALKPKSYLVQMTLKA
jgi:hypothetical protein